MKIIEKILEYSSSGFESLFLNFIYYFMHSQTSSSLYAIGKYLLDTNFMSGRMLHIQKAEKIEIFFSLNGFISNINKKK